MTTQSSGSAGTSASTTARAGRGRCASTIACCPLFVLDPVLLGGRFRSADRTAWMLDACARSTRSCVRAAAGWRCAAGAPEEVVPEVAAEVGADAVYAARRRLGFARARDGRVDEALGDLRLVRHPGCSSPTSNRVLTKDGRPFTVYSPVPARLGAQERRSVVQRAPRDRAAVRRERRPDAVAGVARVRRPAPDLEERPSRREAAARQGGGALGARRRSARYADAAQRRWPSRPRG